MPLQCARPSAMLPACRALWHYLALSVARIKACDGSPLTARTGSEQANIAAARRRRQPWRTRVVAAPVGAGEYSLSPLQVTHSLTHPRARGRLFAHGCGRAGGRRRGIGVAQWGGPHGTAQRRPPRRCSACIHCVRQPALQSRVLNEWCSAAEIEARRRSASPSACPVGHHRQTESLAALCVRTETGMLCSG
jgi:hypothetical protein